MVPPGIRFNDYLFTEPTRLADLTVPKYAGLFAILVKDANWAPKPYQPLYFGEFGNNTPEVRLPRNYGFRREGDTELLVSLLPLPFSTTAQRWALRNELLRAFNPAWQAKEIRSAAISLPNQLGEVDKYPQEAAQILQLFEPHPEREPRRRIGFVP